jgi:ArsR family transcriptional regulator
MDVSSNNICTDIDRAQHCAGILKALSHPIRLRIVALLSQGKLNVSDLSERLNAHQAIVSQQLRILRMAGLVSFERKNGYAYYELAEPRLAELVRCMEGCM